jgi:hypothetical protein
MKGGVVYKNAARRSIPAFVASNLNSTVSLTERQMAQEHPGIQFQPVPLIRE